MSQPILRLAFLSMALLVAPSARAQTANAISFEDDDDDYVITGEIQKPEVTLEITRANLNKAYDFELKESFLPKIVEALDHAPF